jgi:hypothetical protein
MIQNDKEIFLVQNDKENFFFELMSLHQSKN